jgi:mycothiol system anti-sigma-R factor
MNCADCEDKLDRYLDRELTEVEISEVRQHLVDCPPCEDLFELQVHVKRLVKVCCDQGEAPEHLRAKLKQILS